MTRTVQECKAQVAEVPVDGLSSELIPWLAGQAQSLGLEWLLAHFDDGVVWGKLEGGRLVTSFDVATGFPRPRLETLQRARVFGGSGELLLWKVDGMPRARLIREDAEVGARWTQAYDEEQVLWGTHPAPASNGFTVMTDGVQGLRHAVPLDVATSGGERPLRLGVRTYICYDSEGRARVEASRLTGLRVVRGDR